MKNRCLESWVNGIYLSGDMQRSEELMIDLRKMDDLEN